MTLPSYARGTVSSGLKTSPKASKVEHPETPQGTPKKLKRPSTLTIEDRRKIAYNADLFPIKPVDPTKTCLLSELPSEIRTIIFAFALEQDSPLKHPRRKLSARRDQRLQYIWPSLLHVCRAIRLEAAYTYYVSTPFTFYTFHLDFSAVSRWVEVLPRTHRILLSKNRHLTINVDPRGRRMYTYPPKDYIVDAKIKEHWKTCQPFSNLYMFPEDIRRMEIFYCRMASWWLWCARPVHENIKWNYSFQEENLYSGTLEDGDVSRMSGFLKCSVLCLALPCMQRAWTGPKCEDKMVKEARSFLEALENVFDGLPVKNSREGEKMVEVRKHLTICAKVLDKWERGEGRQVFRSKKL